MNINRIRDVYGDHLVVESGANDEFFLVIEVISDVDRPLVGRSVRLGDARALDLECDVGEQLLFQVFYRSRDVSRAAEQDHKFGLIIGVVDSVGRLASKEQP